MSIRTVLPPEEFGIGPCCPENWHSPLIILKLFTKNRKLDAGEVAPSTILKTVSLALSELVIVHVFV